MSYPKHFLPANPTGNIRPQELERERERNREKELERRREVVFLEGMVGDSGPLGSYRQAGGWKWATI